MDELIELAQYVDEGMLLREMRAAGVQHSIFQCAETARSLAPDQVMRIETYEKIYSEILESEIKDWQLKRYVSLLFGILTEEQRRSFVSIEFVSCRGDGISFDSR